MDEKQRKQIRSEYKAEARDHLGDRKGCQAVVSHYDPETGQVRTVWAGEAEHRTSKDAIAVGKLWVEAEIGRRERLAMLADRRKEALPALLLANCEKVDKLEAQRKEINAAIKDLETENRTLVNETVSPRIEINVYEGTQTFTYTVTERGKKVDVDDRQMGLFSEGVSDEPTTEAPSIHDLAGGPSNPDAAWPE